MRALVSSRVALLEAALDQRVANALDMVRPHKVVVGGGYGLLAIVYTLMRLRVRRSAR